MLATTEAHILVEEKQMQGKANSELHRQWIKLYPDTLEVLVLIVHEGIHPSYLLDELLVRSGSWCLIELPHFRFKRFEFIVAPVLRSVLAVSGKIRVNLCNIFAHSLDNVLQVVCLYEHGVDYTQVGERNRHIC